MGFTDSFAGRTVGITAFVNIVSHSQASPDGNHGFPLFWGAQGQLLPGLQPQSGLLKTLPVYRDMQIAEKTLQAAKPFE